MLLLRNARGKGSRIWQIRSGQNTAIKWGRYIPRGTEGIYDVPRSGKPKIYPEGVMESVFDFLAPPPPGGHATWNPVIMAENPTMSSDRVWTIEVRLPEAECFHLFSFKAAWTQRSWHNRGVYLHLNQQEALEEVKSKMKDFFRIEKKEVPFNEIVNRI